MSTARTKIEALLRDAVEVNPSLSSHDSEKPTTTALTFTSIADIIAERRAPEWILRGILERRVLAILAGARGTFKSFIALEWVMRAAMMGEPSLILSGEGAGLGMRAEARLKEHAPGVDPASLPIVALERPLALSMSEEMESLAQAISLLPKAPSLILLDTWSKFAGGLDENSNSEVATYLSSLSRNLRETYGSTVLIVAHTGHVESGRPRGASALAANTDAEYIVQRAPLAMTVTVSRERFKDTPSLPPLAYEARVVDLGRLDQYGDMVTSLALHDTDAPAPQVKGAGKNQNIAMVALTEWARITDKNHITTAELVEVLRAQGIKDRRRRTEVVAFLTQAGVLGASVGGHIVNREAL